MSHFTVRTNRACHSFTTVSGLAARLSRATAHIATMLPAIVLLNGTAAHAQNAPGDGAIATDASRQCDTLSARLDARSMQNLKSDTVAAAGDMPEYCRITGTIFPTITFEMRLPLKGWNGKFYQAGCGGFCGVLRPDIPGYSNGIAAAVRRGYAAIVTDNGHTGKTSGDASWAKDNPQAIELYADRWIPLTHTAGNSIVRSFYGQSPKRQYFVGCSNGGRAALIAAQRYPRLFDGIISGCPVIDLTTSGGIFGAWKMQTNGDGINPVLTEQFAAKVAPLAEQVIAPCDAIDGVRDGLIADPFKCKADVSKIPLCGDGSKGAGQAGEFCLTADEKRVVAQWYQGPVDSKGRSLFGGMPAGSEFTWPAWYLQDTSEAAGTRLADGFIRYLAFEKADPDALAVDFDFDRDPARMAKQGQLLNATDPDLRAFRKAGGKMILWHGLADALVIPNQSRTYYQSVVQRMGGSRKVQEFFRYFEAPGLGHCWIEVSPHAPEEFDPLTAIENWVENGQAPNELVARPSARQPEARIEEIRYRPFPLPPLVKKAAMTGQ